MACRLVEKDELGGRRALPAWAHTYLNAASWLCTKGCTRAGTPAQAHMESSAPCSSLVPARMSASAAWYTRLRFWLYVIALLKIRSKSPMNIRALRYWRANTLSRIICDGQSAASSTSCNVEKGIVSLSHSATGRVRCRTSEHRN